MNNFRKGKILIVEDEKVALNNLVHILEKEGYEVVGTTSGSNALRLLEEQQFDLVLTDLKMERVDGLEVLERTKYLYPDTEVIMITAYASIPSAVETMKKGAYDYIAKPFKLDEVRKAVRDAIEKVKLKKENAILRAELEKFSGKVRIITQNSAMQRLLDTARQIAPTDCNVVLTGESGTGKELLSRFIHNHSRRAGGQFFAVNCGAFSEELLSNELFGHEKGAFTGATTKGYSGKRGAEAWLNRAYKGRCQIHSRYKQGYIRGDKGRKIQTRPLLQTKCRIPVYTPSCRKKR